MAETSKRRNLGRGLSALLGEANEDYAALDRVRHSKTVPVEFLHPGRYQPRHHLDDAGIEDLAASIRDKGILQPILVRRHPDEANAFEIIAGERRWRAAQRAQLHEVPVIIKDLSDREALEIALIENIQRESLSALEEAAAYRRLMEEFEHTQEDLGRAVGKSRSHVANTMRLLGLPEPVKEMVERGELTAGHARALLRADDPLDTARQVVRRGLNVRQTERLLQKADAAPRPGRAKGGSPRAGGEAGKDADTVALERDLESLLGLKVEIAFHGGGGRLTLHYGSLEQLDDILHRLSNGAHGRPTAAAEESERIHFPDDEVEALADDMADDAGMDDAEMDDGREAGWTTLDDEGGDDGEAEDDRDDETAGGEPGTRT